MSLRPAKGLVVLLMCLSLLGQAWAYAASPCLMSSPFMSAAQMAEGQAVEEAQADSAMASSQNMDHSGHHMSHSLVVDASANADLQAVQMDNCCGIDGHCTLSGCASVAVAAPPLDAMQYLPTRQGISAYSFALIDLSSSSLYRPPISR